ncbi:MAG TPA: calcium-binding protein, partial [Acidobacteriota bacterium]
AEVTELQESPAAQIAEQQTEPVQTKRMSAANTSIRGETMMSSLAWKSQLDKQLSQAEAERQVNDKTTYVKPFSGEEAEKKVTLPKTLFTGDGDDNVRISEQWNGNVRVDVNGKEAWSGTKEEFNSLIIDTCAGNDTVSTSVDRTNIFTGAGDDVVYSRSNDNLIDTGDGKDYVSSVGDNNLIQTGDGNDYVASGRLNNQIETGAGDDIVDVSHGNNKVNTGDGDDSVRLAGGGWSTLPTTGNEVDTGSGNDHVEVNGGVYGARIQTGDGIDTIQLHEGSEGNTVDTGEGNDVVDDAGLDNNVV